MVLSLDMNCSEDGYVTIQAEKKASVQILDTTFYDCQKFGFGSFFAMSCSVIAMECGTSTCTNGSSRFQACRKRLKAPPVQGSTGSIRWRTDGSLRPRVYRLSQKKITPISLRLGLRAEPPLKV